MSKRVWKLPRYKILRNIIAQDIAVGKYPPGSELPGTFELCKIYKVSHNTVELAIRMLAEEKLIRCRRGCRAKVLAAHKKSNLWIAIVSNNLAGDILANYQESPWLWTICNEITSRLLRDGNVALQLSLSGRWQEHLNKADGLIVVTLNQTAHRLKELPENLLSAIPCVYIDPRSVPLAENTLKLDYTAACRQIATYFLVNGVDCFLVYDIVDLCTGSEQGILRFNEFYRTLKENNISDDKIIKLHEINSITNEADLLEVIKKYLQEQPANIKIGVLCSQDIVAAKVCAVAGSCGRSLKKDLFVAGISGLPEHYSTNPALSSIKVPFEEIAEQSLDMLYGMIIRKICRLPGVQYNLKFCPRDT